MVIVFQTLKQNEYVGKIDLESLSNAFSFLFIFINLLSVAVCVAGCAAGCVATARDSQTRFTYASLTRYTRYFNFAITI